MTTIPAIAASAATRNPPGGFAHWFASPLNGVVAYWMRRQAVKSLSELDDRALRDIGIDRCHIEAAVYGCAMNPELGRLR